MAFITRSAKNYCTPLNNFWSHFDWPKSLYADFCTPQGHFTKSHQLRTMNERCHTNSIPWMYAIGLNKSCFPESTNCVHSWYGVSVTAFIHSTELVWPRSFMVRSWCDREHSWYGVGVIPQSHSTWFLCTLYSGNSFGGFFPSFTMTSAAINLLCVSVTIRINRVVHSQHNFSATWIIKMRWTIIFNK